jgi:hypothetical protein
MEWLSSTVNIATFGRKLVFAHDFSPPRTVLVGRAGLAYTLARILLVPWSYIVRVTSLPKFLIILSNPVVVDGWAAGTVTEDEYESLQVSSIEF